MTWRWVTAGAVVIALGAWGIGELWPVDRDQLLLDLPQRIENAIQEHEFGEAVAPLASDFRAGGVLGGFKRDQIRMILADRFGGAGWGVYVCEVWSDPETEGSTEREIVVIGLVVQGDVTTVPRSSMKTFRVRASCSWQDSNWEVSSADLDY